MRLPLKFKPRKSQLIADLAGAAVMFIVGLAFFSNYASPGDLGHYPSFVDWLRANAIQVPFMLGSIGLLLFGLAWLVVAAINLFGDSPFNYLLLDRQGLTHRNFWGESRYSWKDLGRIEPLRISAWQSKSSQRRNWIVAETLGTEGGGGSMAFWSNSGRLRIPASAYVGGGMLIGTLELATADAAGWLEELRQMARADRLIDEDIPPLPDCFTPPIEVEYAGYDDQPRSGSVER